MSSVEAARRRHPLHAPEPAAQPEGDRVRKWPGRAEQLHLPPRLLGAVTRRVRAAGTSTSTLVDDGCGAHLLGDPGDHSPGGEAGEGPLRLDNDAVALQGRRGGAGPAGPGGEGGGAEEPTA